MNFSTRLFSASLLLVTAVFFLSACQNETAPNIVFDEPDHSEEHLDDGGEIIDDIQNLNCQKATQAQIKVVNEGNKLANDFLAACYAATDNSPRCQELMRPNPDSRVMFACTYGTTQTHRLIHPDRNTWKHAFKAVWLIKQLEAKNFRVYRIYNWWRPEPYNVNVGGKPARHPFGTSVDVEFYSVSDANKAHGELCKLRKQGHLRALGHYGTTGLHFGVGDSLANTWGQGCPG